MEGHLCLLSLVGFVMIVWGFGQGALDAPR